MPRRGYRVIGPVVTELPKDVAARYLEFRSALADTLA